MISGSLPGSVEMQGKQKWHHKLEISNNQSKMAVDHVLTYRICSPNLDPRWSERQLTPKSQRGQSCFPAALDLPESFLHKS